MSHFLNTIYTVGKQWLVPFLEYDIHSREAMAGPISGIRYTQSGSNGWSHFLNTIYTVGKQWLVPFLEYDIHSREAMAGPISCWLSSDGNGEILGHSRTSVRSCFM